MGAPVDIINGIVSLQFVAGPDTFATEHAFVHVEGKEGIGVIDRQFFGPRSHKLIGAGIQAEIGSDLLKLTPVIFQAGKTGPVMIGRDKLSSGFPYSVYLVVIGDNNHSLLHHGSAGGGHPPAADLNKAQPAHPGRFQVGMVAQVRYVDTIVQGGIKNYASFGHRNGYIVYMYFHKLHPVMPPVFPVSREYNAPR